MKIKNEVRTEINMHERMSVLMRDIKYKDWELQFAECNGGILMRWKFKVDGHEWTTRKWYVSQHSTDSEIVQTALKAVLTAEEHEAREHFLYRGRTIFGPHHSVDALLNLPQDVRYDDRDHNHEAYPADPLKPVASEAKSAAVNIELGVPKYQTEPPGLREFLEAYFPNEDYPKAIMMPPAWLAEFANKAKPKMPPDVNESLDALTILAKKSIDELATAIRDRESPRLLRPLFALRSFLRLMREHEKSNARESS